MLRPDSGGAGWLHGMLNGTNEWGVAIVCPYNNEIFALRSLLCFLTPYSRTTGRCTSTPLYTPVLDGESRCPSKCQEVHAKKWGVLVICFDVKKQIHAQRRGTHASPILACVSWFCRFAAGLLLRRFFGFGLALSSWPAAAARAPALTLSLTPPAACWRQLLSRAAMTIAVPCCQCHVEKPISVSSRECTRTGSPVLGPEEPEGSSST